MHPDASTVAYKFVVVKPTGKFVMSDTIHATSYTSALSVFETHHKNNLKDKDILVVTSATGVWTRVVKARFEIVTP